MMFRIVALQSTLSAQLMRFTLYLRYKRMTLQVLKQYLSTFLLILVHYEELLSIFEFIGGWGVRWSSIQQTHPG